jgi:hypothetical protein
MAADTPALAAAAHQGDDESPAVLDVGTAGAGALREYERRKAKDDAVRAQRSALWRALNGFFYPDGRQTTNAWKVGAAGEQRVASALTMLVEAQAGYALHDRRVPGKQSNIDHIFVGATGVFVIDAKRYKNAEVTVERTGGLFAPMSETLKVGGRRKVGIVQGIQKQCDVVAAALTNSGHRDIPVVPILCFVEAYLPWRTKNRRVGNVRLSGPKGLAELVAAGGPLDDDQRLAIARALSQALPSMS